MPVYLSLAPPDGFARWTGDEWDAWLREHPLEPAELVSERSEWFVFLYMARVHGRQAASELAPFLERLIVEKPFESGEIPRLREALAALRTALEDIPAGRLWTGTQFYSADYLFALIDRKERETGRTGQDLRISDLWRPLFGVLETVLARAEAAGRGVYFGHL